MGTVARLGLLVGLVLCSLLAAPPRTCAEPVQAGDSERPPALAHAPARPDLRNGWGEGRVMAQHRFPFAPFLASSFIVSSFAVHAGTDVRRVPRFPLDATTGALVAQRIDLATVRITQGAAGSVRLHRLFALTFAVSGEARIGTNS